MEISASFLFIMSWCKLLMLVKWGFMLQYPWTMCYYHVWCYCPANIQKCSHLAPWSLQVCKLKSLKTFWMFCLKLFGIMLFCDMGNICSHDSSGSVRTSQLFFAVTRLMSRTGKLRQSRLHSTGRRICSTMRFQLRATTTLKSHSYIWPGNLQGSYH